MTFDPNEPLMGIGVASKKLGVSPELLRLYEREGLLEIHKIKSGHRLYSENDLSWISCIRRQITEEKMNIAGIRVLLALMPCWEMRTDCSISDCENCKAYKNSNVVCWTLNDQSAKICQETNCRECNVYIKACHAGKFNRMHVVIDD